MTEVYLLLGSNENNRLRNLETARKLINHKAGKITRFSSLYETDAWGLKEQSAFINQALAVETGLSPFDLLTVLKDIEKEVGRVKTVKWGPRVIDIDILFYGNEVVREEHLKVPHPYLHERRFTLAPLSELAAEIVHPVLGKTVTQLLTECPDDSLVKKLQA